MAISINPYQISDYWRIRDNSVTSPLHNKASKTESVQESQISKSQSPKELQEANQGSESSQSKDKNKNQSSNQYNEADFSDSELALLKELKKSDIEVRTHEMAHIAAGGQYVTSGARLEYQKGPDGVSYAVAGEVSIDTSPIAGDPQATVEKMRQVQRAALAPASPSNQDIKVAANAGALASKAMSEMILLQSKERIEANENKAFGSLSARQAADSYSKVNSMPTEPQASQFKIAV
ncbi:MAG: SprA-related family protein [Desulfamplus sp.]|nr:SprA-related family protein [Desulfamplus sp.]